MKLLNLQLENFQGIKLAAFDFEGQSGSIYGDNATGKTTIYNAITWLLFDLPSTGAKNFTPKTKGTDGDLHFLNHAAEAKFKMDDGRTVILRKVFHENYKKKRGSATEEFSGHSTDFYIDGVPVKEQEYTSTLLAFCGGAERMKMLTMPHYFAEDMAWEARRKILLDICGDVSDEEVIAATEELEELPVILLRPGAADQYYTVDEYKKIAAVKKNDINKRLQDIPGRIDEAERAIPDTTGLDAGAIAKRTAELSLDRDKLSEEKARILAGDTARAEARANTSDANTKMAEARAAYATKAAAGNEGTLTAVGELQRQLVTIRGKISKAKQEKECKQRNADRMTNRRQAILEDYLAVQAETWVEDKAICPTCHRELPEDEIVKRREDFNLNKSNRLLMINEQGRKEASKTMIEAEKAAIEELTASISTNEQTAADLETQLEALQQTIQKPQAFETTEEYAALASAIASCREKEQNTGKNTDEALEAVNTKIQAVSEESRKLQDKQASLTLAETQRKRIEELKKIEETLAAEYEELEKGIYLCDLFTKAKVDMLTDRINGKFKNVRFRLFIEQQNGGVRDDCEVMIPADGGRMIPFAFANNAARINAGLEIIDALSQHWAITMPVFIDNAESVTRLANMTTQVIRLVVSEPDVKLRLEVEAA